MPDQTKIEPRWRGRIRQFGSAKVSLQFLGSYLLILIIPLIIFVLLLDSFYLSRMEHKVEEDNKQLITTIGNNIVTALDGMRNIAHQISKNPDLSTYHLTDSPLNARDGINQLANYLYGQHLIDDIALVCEKSQYVYTSRFAPKTADFLGGISASSLGDAEMYERFFVDHGQFLPVSRNIDGIWVRQLIYILREDTSSSANRRAVLIFISQNKLDSVLAAAGGYVVLQHDNGNIIAHTGDGQSRSPDQLSSLLETQTDLVPSSRENGEFLSTYHNSMLNLSLVMSKSWELTMGDVLILKNKSFMILGAVFLLGIMMILFGMRMLYMPLYRLKKYAESALGTSAKGNDEFEVLDLALTHYASEHATMMEKLASGRNLIREKTILALLQGCANRQGIIEQSERESGIVFPFDGFCVVLMLPATAEHATLILSAAEKMTDGPVVIAGAMPSQGECVSFIFNFDLAHETGMPEFIHLLAESMSQQLGCRLTVGVGGCCRRRIDIGRSYIEAATALDYRLIYGVGQVIFSSDIEPADETRSTIPYDLMKKLEISMLDGNTEAASDIVDQTIAFMKQGGVSLCSARCFAYDMVNTILKVMSISHTTVSNDLMRHSIMTDFETIDELAASIKDTADQLCAIIVSNKSRYHEGLLGSIHRYIEDNFLDYNFTVKRLAAEFGMSESNISHYYKKATGHNISETINDLRINKAKLLLTHTNLSVREIVEAIGYSDVSSFTRKFRLTIGASPGSYRQTYAESSSLP